MDSDVEILPADPDASAEQVTREIVTILSAFQRFSPAQIATALQLAPDMVEQIACDPVVVENIATLRKLMPRPGDVHELLMTDAETNIRWLQGLRDGKVDDMRLDREPTTLRIRARAAEVLLDRQAPKRVEVATNPLKTMDITDMQMNRMRRLLEGSVA